MRETPFWRRYLRLLGSDPAADVEDELSFHLAMRVEDLVRRGLSQAEAREQATREFGDVRRIRAELQDMGHRRLQRERRARWWDSLGQDLRLGARTLRRNPGFAWAAVLTLALGVGANTAIFSVVNGVLLKPLPYPDAEGILTLWQHDREHGIQEVAPANFLDWRERSRSFELMAAIEPFSLDHLGPDGPETIDTWLVTEGFFEVLRTPALIGRTFGPDEYGAGGERVVVLGYGVWRRRFGADPDIVGRTLVLDGEPTAVIGVMPPEFDFPAGQALWAPKVFSERDRQNRSSAYYHVIGRLRPGASPKAARDELGGIAEQLAREHPLTNAGVGISLVPLPERLVGRIRPALLVLLGAVGFVLLIACANVANLMLVRAASRERDFAIRAALGAGRGRVVRQLLIESLLIAALGATAALLLTRGALRLIRSLSPPSLPRIDGVGMDHRVIAFALLVALGTAVLVGLVPALQIARSDLQHKLRASGHTATGGRGLRRFRSVIVIGELVLAMVLLIGAGLLVRSFAALLQVERGYRTENVLAVTVQTWQYYPSGPQRVAFVQQTLERLASLPGVRTAGVTSSLPLAEGIGADVASFEIEGRSPPPSGGMPTAHASSVTVGYFEALSIALRRGRLFEVSDHADAPPVVVINEAMARRYWPGEDPLGKKLTVRFAGPVAAVREVVGVVADVRHSGLDDEPRPALFFPHAQAPTGALTFVVRTVGDPLGLLPAVREEIWTMNRAMPIADATTLDRLLAESLEERRFNLLLLLAFSLVALALATVGVYGVLSHETTRRTREIGLRLALGAERRRVLHLVIGEGLRMAMVGIGLGILLALAVTRVLSAFLFGISASDPVTFACIAALLIGVTLLASYLPARRATRVDPIVALRAE